MQQEFQSPGLSITINGQRRATAATTVAMLVEELNLPPAKVAVERNREIVPKSTYATAPISEGDQIEIVHFVGGG
ncbi:thiazole biosynthesis protein [Parvularcula bermudensis HTCC2503]|uniref:Thiazole biosynthesis protein n=1 Tax=Parvularcula bermudensis (strain ATCC BAA-594 / HTCC2503 / KCTC 12087) TaxID=314260 RepID=E0TDU0_PARBH|nr:sulfur carrier protein ThiS [Parvularcula bermudensis]ADM10006.1 thiazole biosynthesis protein [Parvularcula bermudensis HTCC2503]